MLNSLRKNVEISGWRLERARLRAEPCIDSKIYGTAGKPCPFNNTTPRVFRKLLSRFCPFAFNLALLSLFMVEDNSVSLVPAFVPACGCQRTR
jgi:hypothetical protein